METLRDIFWRKLGPDSISVGELCQMASYQTEPEATRLFKELVCLRIEFDKPGLPEEQRQQLRKEMLDVVASVARYIA